MKAGTEEQIRAAKESKPVKLGKQRERRSKTERGMVTRVADGYAYLRFERRAICDKCGICKIDVDSVHVVARVKNTLDAHRDDYVEVDMKRRPVLLFCLIYLVPLVLTVIGLSVGYTYSALTTALCAVAGLVVGLAIAIPLDFLVFRRKLSPKMIGFTSPEASASTASVSTSKAEARGLMK